MPRSRPLSSKALRIGPLFPLIKPILPDLVSITSNISSDDQPTVVAKLFCKTGEAATKTLKQTNALITMAKLVRVTGTTGSTPSRENADHELLVKLLNSLKTSCVDRDVNVEMKIPCIVGDLLVLSQMRNETEEGKMKTAEYDKK
jgi:hypothetical protein